MKIKKLKYFEKKPHERELDFIPVLYPGQIRISTCWFFVEGGFPIKKASEIPSEQGDNNFNPYKDPGQN